MSHQTNSKSTFTLRIADGGGTFRCQAINSVADAATPQNSFDTNRLKMPQRPTGQMTQRAGRVITRQGIAATSFRIGVSTAMFRIAG